MSYAGPGQPIYDLDLHRGSRFRSENAFPIRTQLVAPEAMGAVCTMIFAPVVTTDGGFYDSACTAEAAGARVARRATPAESRRYDAQRRGLGQTAAAPSQEEIARARLDAQISSESGVPVPSLRAIRSIESGGNPRAVRFETRVFRNRTGQTVEGHDRAAFQRAYAINPLEAVNSTSWGWFQVMGFHGFPAMYGGPAQAVAAFDANPEEVGMRLFKRWMDRPQHLAAKLAARTLNFATFARLYNGCCRNEPPGCTGCERYRSRMQAAYDRALPEWRLVEPYTSPIRTPGAWPSWTMWAIAGGAGAGVLGVVGAAVWAVKRRRARA